MPTWWIDGVPAPFATAGEAAWKQTLRAALPAADGYSGDAVELDFTVDTRRRIADLDNLCEPVLSVLVNSAGWVGGRRSNITNLRATRRRGGEPGCRVTVGEVKHLSLTGTVVMDTLYSGPLPTSAQDPVLSAWITSQPFATTTGGLAVEVLYSSLTPNLGDIATGPTKRVIDGLWPILGGRAGAPADERIAALLVTKRALDQEGIRIVARRRV